ncbi:RNA-directed DNA polymerase, eukaryota, reverse transcriptase zinc-binding domain protein [Tanacetum coccineum]
MLDFLYVIIYRDKDNKELCTKQVQVKLDWSPQRCSNCCVFGHNDHTCGKKEVHLTKNVELGKKNVADIVKESDVGVKENDCFTQVRNRKTNGERLKPNQNPNNQHMRNGVFVQRGRTENQFKFQRKDRNGQDSSDKTEYANNRPTVKEKVQKENNENSNGKKNLFDDQKEVNDVMPDNSGIAKGWNSDVVNLTLIHEAKQSIFCLVEAVNGQFRSYCTIVYAANTGNERKKLWGDLNRYKHLAIGNPWFLGGDFNVTLKVAEHSAGTSVMTSDMHDFYDCINQIEVEDMCSSGLNFTWTKNLHKVKKGDFSGILKKLDRLMINEEFLKRFTSAFTVFMPYLISDHTPIIMNIPDGIVPKKKSFKFSNFIAENDEFLKLIEKEWKKKVSGCDMFKVVKRMRSLKVPLKKLSWKNGNVFNRVNQLKTELQKIQSDIDKDPYDKVLRSEEAKILELFLEASKEEEMLLLQKSKIKWLSLGDTNNSYFHRVVQSNQQRNRVVSICDEAGKRFEGKDVPEQIVNHFKGFLGVSYPVSTMDDVDSLFVKKVTEADALFMIRDVSDKEVRDAMFDIGDNKAPGPDGFNACFFKKAWSVIGKDVIKAVKEFFLSGRILGDINATIISLIPKIQVPNKVSDFRPIACAIHIQDNILLTQELLKGYDKKRGPKRVAFKIDIQKAYDTVNWSFLEVVLTHVNGESHGFFKGGRGLRQGDPISPYLFTIVMEVFTLMMRRNISRIQHLLELSRIQWRSLAGKLLMRYLRVPLITKRLGVKDCKVLIDKINGRENNWKNKCLSYAGRLLLIASILESIHVYWATVFLLPKTVINDINKLLKGFLWCNGEMTRGKAKVTWKNICRPKDRGGDRCQTTP